MAESSEQQAEIITCKEGYGSLYSLPSKRMEEKNMILKFALLFLLQNTLQN